MRLNGETKDVLAAVAAVAGVLAAIGFFTALAVVVGVAQ